MVHEPLTKLQCWYGGREGREWKGEGGREWKGEGGDETGARCWYMCNKLAVHVASSNVKNWYKHMTAA